MSVWVIGGPRQIGKISFDIHTLLGGCGLMIIGVQAIVFAFLTKVFAITEGWLPEDTQLSRIGRYVTLEMGIVTGFMIIAAGLIGALVAILNWRGTGFGALDPVRTMRLFIPAITACVIGSQTVLASFYLSILGLKRRS